MWNGKYGFGINPTNTRCTFRVNEKFTTTAELYASGILRAFHLPDITVAQPAVGLLNLRTVCNVLPEHPVFVAYAIPCDREIERCTTVQKAGSKSAQTTVTQAGIRFLFCHSLEFHTESVQRLFHSVLEIQIEQCIAKRTAH